MVGIVLTFTANACAKCEPVLKYICIVLHEQILKLLTHLLYLSVTFSLVVIKTVCTISVGAQTLTRLLFHNKLYNHTLELVLCH